MNIFSKGNYILFLNEAENVLIQKSKSKVEVEKESVNSDIYSFYYDGKKFLELDFAEIEDENNTPFSDKATFEAYIRKNTGFKTVAGGSATEFIYIFDPEDFPTPVSGVITLSDNATYYIGADIDLKGNRIVGGQDSVIMGFSSENCSLTSTGLGAGVPLFTTEWTTPIRHVTLKDVDTAISIDGTTNPPVALDWTGVNFLNVPNIGTINTADNFIYSKGAFLNSQNLKFSGTVGTVGIDNSIFVGTGSAGNILDILSTCTITRRFRLIYSSVVVFGSTTGINVDASASIPTEGYILDTINFSGGGTYLGGVSYTDNKTRFVNCKGIPNTSEIGNYFMSLNATETVISVIDEAVKIAGTTTANTVNQKFSHSNNRLTYTGGLIRDFQISATATLNSGNNNVIGLYVAKNGTVIPSSEMYATTSSGGRAESIACQTIVELQEGDYIEMFVENSTALTNVTVEYLNTIVKSLN